MAWNDETDEAEAAPGGRVTLPLNAFELGGRRFLRVVIPRGTILHLALHTGPTGRGRPAHDRRPRSTSGDDALAVYDPVALQEPTWTRRTLCGLVWKQMATHDAELDALVVGLADGPIARHGYQCPVCEAVTHDPGL